MKSLFRFDDDFSNDDCSSPVHCHAGCVCNDGLVRDHKGNCVTEEDCERNIINNMTPFNLFIQLIIIFR